MTTEVAQPTARYQKQKQLRDLPRTLLGGTPAMIDAGKTYLPQHPAESNGSYEIRLKKTVLFGAFDHALNSQVGKMFAKPISLGEDMPERLIAAAENIDLQGRALNPFARDLFYDAMADGISFILVDYPRTDGRLTLADERRQGIRPYAIIIQANQLIGWRYETINGIVTLTQARIAETIAVPEGDFGEVYINCIRVLYRGGYEVWTDIGNGDYEITDEGVFSVPFIPLIPVYTNRTGFFEGSPPLRSLAELSLEHWDSSSEQRHALTMQRFGMLSMTGVSDEEAENIQVGPAKKLNASNPDAKFYYTEPAGTGISLGFTDLDNIERRMQSVGMELRIERGGQVTATAAAIDSSESNAGLQAVAEGFKDALEQMFVYMGAFIGMSEDQTGSVNIHTDFDAGLADGKDLQELGRARSAGEISRQTYWNEMKRRGVLSDDFNAEDESALLELEGPSLSDVG